MSEANIEGNRVSPLPAEREPDHFRRAMIIWVVLSIIGVVVWVFLAPVILPQGASNLDSTDDFTITILTLLSIPVSQVASPVSRTSPVVSVCFRIVFFRCPPWVRC